MSQINSFKPRRLRTLFVWNALLQTHTSTNTGAGSNAMTHPSSVWDWRGLDTEYPRSSFPTATTSGCWDRASRSNTVRYDHHSWTNTHTQNYIISYCLILFISQMIFRYPAFTCICRNSFDSNIRFARRTFVRPRLRRTCWSTPSAPETLRSRTPECISGNGREVMLVNIVRSLLSVQLIFDVKIE